MQILLNCLLAAWMLLSLSAQADEPAPGSIWVEPKTGMEFVWIPGGCFLMGSDAGNPNEIPVHQVCVKGFYLGKYEVTQAQYQEISDSNPSQFKGGNLPVDQVSFLDIKENITAFNYRAGEQLRLPSEAEWEYACRGGGQHREYCGDGDVDNLAWHNGNSGNKTHAVGTLRPNAWGLYDMSGNVLEWTEDCWHEDYTGAPTDGTAWHAEHGGNCDLRVIRGGSWKADPWGAQAAFRDGFAARDRDGYYGFRLARTLP